MKKFFGILSTAAILGISAFPDQAYVPSAANLENRRWFQDAKFGLFIHWGIYSLLADGEWVFQEHKLPLSEYEKLPDHFNPEQFDPKEWVSLAKAAGMKYITITSKHHDGFALFDSKVSDWNVVARTPYKKDILKMLADECHAQGIKLFFYYSQLDWHHPDYFPRGTTGNFCGRPLEGNWNNYLQYMNAQLEELLTNYGPIAGIWFDGWWDKPKADWKLDTTYSLIHSLHPDALVGSNHHLKPMSGEDFQMMERDLPGHNTAGFSAHSELSDLPLEVCQTINNSWGFNSSDTNCKSTRELIQYLVRAAGYGSNLLLNVGPMANGKIPAEFCTRLREMGAWLEKYGATIYDTRKGPIEPQAWGVSTQKDNIIYLHILEQVDSLHIPFTAPVTRITYFDDGSTVEYENVDDGIVLQSLRQHGQDEYDLVIEIECI